MPINHANKYAELTDNQFLLIGKIVVEFSNIEFLLKNLLTRLLMTSDFLGRTYTDNLMISKIQESIENALDIHASRYGENMILGDKVKEIKDLNSRIKSIRLKEISLHITAGQDGTMILSLGQKWVDKFQSIINRTKIRKKLTLKRWKNFIGQHTILLRT